MQRGAASLGARCVSVVIFFAFGLLLCVDSYCASARSLIVYYANETVPDALASRNYRALLTALDGMGDETGQAAADSLRSDVQTFRAKAFKDISSLQDFASSKAVDLAAFTNTFALRNKYLAVRFGIAESRSVNFQATPNDPVTEHSPLSSQINFRLALTEALREYGEGDKIILIVNSHGTKEFAVIPRVAADFTQIDMTRLRKALENEQANDLAVRTVEMRGIRKTDLWRELDFATAVSRAHFSLVFLQACESAASSWAEYFSMPSTVHYVAHTGFRSISPEQFDYALLQASATIGNDDQENSVADLLRQTGVVYFDSKYSYWRWPLLVTAASLPEWLYFVPLSLWLLASLFKVRPGFRPSSVIAG